ncbi:sodium-coupled neutral amino acid transporter 9-like isoform X1 [Patiria miniata]|uniref:Amino acid transporter transmembrane domain-containing protein n=1 Tax=Patiria miniata TaxID=46514 RepID=A0A914AY35_PATMI|nr:sodium-coupled neutral amino acid transporter 9-like isoform X1 [Patiria miniata]XP_038068596.1 sodium-coupled neutral amino acid transporter 9-like isoform X1 [Patiria miniata]XP_038068597.1 sodium-coupled neutral amino acid transporter 9-like isoform X1 [Patiria miniata]XP_038068598.1 sodium-coupled neutral amino acid transporter 9-like isoform X1 [Patiria miniata]
MASRSEKTPLLGQHGNQGPAATKLKPAVAGFQSEEDDLSSLCDVDITEAQKKDKQLYAKFEGPSSGSHLSGALGTSSGSTTAVDSKRRKPFHYSSVPTYLTDDGKIEHAVDEKTAATFNRYRYYSRLAGSPGQRNNTLEIPDHVLPPFLLSVELPFKDKEGKQGSIVTIFSIWNTMMGTSLLSMPWAIQQAGFLMGLFLLVAMAGLTLYTCYRVVKSVQRLESGGKMLEFSDVCREYLGRPGEYAAIFFSLAALLGAMVVYWVLMSNFMYSSVSFIYGRVLGLESTENDTICAVDLPGGNGEAWQNVNMTIIDRDDATETMFAKVWSKTHTVPLFLCILVFPLMNFKSPTFFTKFNALGTLSVLYLIIFISVQAFRFGGFHLDFNNPRSKHYAAFFSGRFPAFSGLLSLGFFIHNAISSILRAQSHPEHNGRDMTIAYVLVAVTYTFVGVMFYSTFPLRKDCLADNLLDNFSHSDVLAFTARLFLLFQMVTLFPLLVFIFRIQCLDPLFKSAYPSWKHVLVLNLILMTVAVLFAVFLPQIGTIIRFSGAFCGLAYIFTLPCVVYLLELRQQGRLTWYIVAIHACIIAIGLANFIAQFFLL